MFWSWWVKKIYVLIYEFVGVLLVIMKLRMMAREEGLVSVVLWLIMVFHPLKLILANMEGLYFEVYFLLNF